SAGNIERRHCRREVRAKSVLEPEELTQSPDHDKKFSCDSYLSPTFFCHVEIVSGAVLDEKSDSRSLTFVPNARWAHQARSGLLSIMEYFRGLELGQTEDSVVVAVGDVSSLRRPVHGSPRHSERDG